MAAPWPSADDVDIVVLAGGDPVATELLPHVGARAWVVAADSGLELTAGLGRTADLVVGDLDSVDPALLQAAQAAGTRVERHPRNKHRTDLAIALDAALECAPARVLVLGGHAGRLDHLLGNALLLCAERYAPLQIVARTGPATATVVHGRARLAGRPGDLISLLPVHGSAHGVRTHGLRWPLHDDVLAPGSSRGVSNELVSPRAEVELATGTLLAIQPGDDTVAHAGGTEGHRPATDSTAAPNADPSLDRTPDRKETT